MKPISSTHLKAANRFLEEHKGAFRRSDLAKVIYPLTNPRSNQKAQAVAGQIIGDWYACQGKVAKAGHVHWEAVAQQSRRLITAGVAVELPELVDLPVKTRAPSSMMLVDLATGEVWVGDRQGWKRARKAQFLEVAKALT